MKVDVGRVGIWMSGRLWPDDEAQAGEIAAELEKLGYGAFWLGGASGDLARQEKILAATSRLVAATGIINVWMAPAEQVAAAHGRIDAAYPHRLLVGVGAGHASNVEPTGQRYERPYSKVVAYLDRLDAAQPPVPPEHRVVAALGPRTVALAGRRAAGAHPYLVNSEHTRIARGVLGDGPLLAPEHKVVLASTRDEARRVAQGTLGRYLRQPNYVANLRRIGFTDEDLAGPGSDRLFDGLVAWGEPETIRRRLQEHYDAGADHVCIQVLADRPGPPRAQWRELAPVLLD